MEWNGVESSVQRCLVRRFVIYLVPKVDRPEKGNSLTPVSALPAGNKVE
jgi:hypothetical protein